MSLLKTMENARILILGASQGIGLGFVTKLLELDNITQVYATYRRQDSASNLIGMQNQYPEKLNILKVDLTNESQISQSIASIQTTTNKLHLVINCVGILHQDLLQPEKSLRQIDREHLLHYFQVNSISAVLVAKHILPLLRHNQPSILATLSAKLGSIGDNKLGGWYGYRASKAALNMLMRTVAVEYGRTSPKTTVVLLHPGTTNTQLSRPFQKNVPPQQLFSVERTVNQLLAVIEKLELEDSGKFFSWDGTVLPW